MHNPAYVGLCVSKKTFNKELDRLHIIHEKPKWLKFKDGATTHTFEDTKKNLYIVVCINKNNKYTIEQVHALLAHEAVHVWRRIKEHIGESQPSEEFEAYAIQNICQELFFGYKEAK